MKLDEIVSARIHPGIGIARVGNSEEYFFGPEIPYSSPPPEGGYRDTHGRLKRQAARFRIYGYDRAGHMVAEITAADAEIVWTVHVANKKAAWYDFDFALDLPAASGRSASPLGYSLTTFANNPGWHDDVSDGPVRATVKIGDRSIAVDSAWIVTGPPNYGPDIVSPQTMYDVMHDALANRLMPKPIKPSFRNDILPLLRQCVDAQWVNAGFLALFGWKAAYEFLRPDFLLKLSAAPGKEDPFKEIRRQIFYSFRNPGGSAFEPLKWPPIYGDAFGSFDNPPGPREGFAITSTLYRLLGMWADGNFDADYPGPPGSKVPRRCSRG